MIFNLWACVPTVPSRSVPGCIKPLIFHKIAPAVSPVIYYVYMARPCWARERAHASLFPGGWAASGGEI